MNAAIRKSLLKYITVFFITFAVLTGALVLTAKLPRSLIQENCLESANYLCERNVFWNLHQEINSTKIDRYADSILLGIAYQYDGEHPLESVMWSSYYTTNYKNENDNLLDAVTYGYEANQQYLRYWHGSNSILRLLLVFLNIQQIYVFNGILMVLLIVLLLRMLAKNKAMLLCIGTILGLILTSVWIVPLSLEYTWTYLLMLIFSVLGLKLLLCDKQKYLGILFLMSGMLTNYVDFLTTETLTLLIPLLLILWMDCHKNLDRLWKDMLKNAAKAMSAWGIGYVGMWMMKWVFASFVLKQNVMIYVSEHIEERIGGGLGMNLWEYLMGAITKNISCLFPLEYGLMGMLIGIVGLLLFLYIGYVYHKDAISKARIGIYAALGIVPYIRYLVLHNHSYMHFFFTYRAQMATILALVMILDELTEWRWLIHADD